MQVALIERSRIERLWPVLAEILWPAVQQDPTGMSMEKLRERLADGRFSLVEGDCDGASGLLAYHLFEEDGELCCFASYLVGKVDGGPRQMLGTMRRLMEAFEASCRAAGVKQVFIGGRDWGRVFPDYELTGDVPNRRRKRL